MGKQFATLEERRLYYRRHYRVNRVRGAAREHGCKCGANATEWAQLHGTTGDDPFDYEAMCHRCHHRYDDRWNEAERAKMSAIVKKQWDESPERRLRMSLYPHRLGTGRQGREVI